MVQQIKSTVIAQYTEKPPCFIESPTTTGKLATVGIGDKASG